MKRFGWGVALGIVLASPVVAQGQAPALQDPESQARDLDRIRLLPSRIASCYAQDEDRLRQRLWPTAQERLPEPGDRLETPLLLSAPTSWGRFQNAVTFDATDAGIGGQLRKVQSKLFIEVSAYDASNPENRWEGVEDSENPERGRTLDFAGGRFMGDLTLAVGTQAASAGLGDVIAGNATVWNLNPIRDVSAQFDFLIRTSLEKTHWGFDALVLRVRAAYLGAFSGINSDGTSEESDESEFTVSLGFSW